MTATDPTTLTSNAAPQHQGGRLAVLQALGLVTLSLVALRSEWKSVAEHVMLESEAAHGLAIPLLIALMIWRRRALLSQSRGRGSLWGPALIALGLAIYAASTWPFNYGYPKQIAFVPLVAGSVLSAAGWKTLRHCLPMLLLLALAIPLGMRHFAFLVIRPETFTLAFAEKLLGMLPGVLMTLEGPDLHFMRDGAKGVIALGDPFRGASLLLASLTIGIFVTFISIRPLWQVIAAAILAGPIVLACNLMRLLTQSLVTIYGGARPIDAWPRISSYIVSMMLAYGLFVALFAILNRIIVRPPIPAPTDPNT